MKKIRNNNSERGVALIFTLAILALLMIMMTAFISNMAVKRRASSNMIQRGQLELLTDAAVARIQAHIFALESDGFTGFDRLTSVHTEDGMTVAPGSNNKTVADTSSLETYLYRASEAKNDVKLYPPSVSWTFKNAPEWVYIPNPIDAAKPLARYAYFAVPDTYPIINLQKALPNNPKDSGGGSTDPVNGHYRTGTKIADLMLLDDYYPFAFGTTVKNPDAIAMPSNIRNDDKTRNNISSGIFFNDIPSLRLTAAVQPDKITHRRAALLQKYASFYNDSINHELYFYGALPNYPRWKTPSAPHFFRRFDLTANTVTSMGVSTLLDWDANDALWFTGNPYDHQTPTSADVFTVGAATRIPFFEKFENGANAESHTFADETIWARQIAANFLDFIKPDDAAVTSDSTDWKTGSPTYTGNKRTRYLNHLGVVVEMDTADVTLDKSLNNARILLYAQPIVEAVDIYGIQSTVPYSAEVHFNPTATVSYTITYDAGAPYSGVITYTHHETAMVQTAELNVNLAPGFFTHNRLAKGNSCKMDILLPGVDHRGSPVSVNIDKVELEIVITKAILRRDTANVDYARLWHSVAVTPVFGGNYDHFEFLHTFDPRQNLNPADWDKVEITTGGLTDYFGTGNLPDGQTIYPPPSGNYDKENFTDTKIGATGVNSPVISTAYHPGGNKALISLASLGNISRGVAWQTLNMSTVQPLTANSAAYAAGDAELFDMVTVDYGKNPKLDLNTLGNSGFAAIKEGDDDYKVWYDVFGNSDNPIYPSIDPDDPINGNTSRAIAISPPPSLTFPTNDFIDGGVIKRLFRRSSLTRSINLSGETDGARDMYIGKVIGIVDAPLYPQELRVVIITQELNPNAITVDDSDEFNANRAILSENRCMAIFGRTEHGRYRLKGVVPAYK